MKNCLVIFTLMLVSCSPKTGPVITARTQEPPPPAPTPPLVMKGEPEKGKGVYSTKCARCHDLPVPAAYTEKRWEGILPVMVSRARLDREEEAHLRAYISQALSK